MFDLQKYLESRNPKKAEFAKEVGPVITISREYGCSGKNLAMELTEKLNNRKIENKDWTWINKEVFEGTADALNLKKEKILHVYEGEAVSVIDGIILSSDDKYYRSDRAIKEKIVDIVRTFAEN